MRKIFLLMHVSLDGYFQDTNKGIDWAQDNGKRFPPTRNATRWMRSFLDTRPMT